MIFKKEEHALKQTNEFETEYIENEIAKCEDITELKERIFPMIQNQQEQWSLKIKEIITESGYSKTLFADLCGVSRVALNKWCNGSIPRNRETFLKIGMAAGYGIEKMNQLLQRYGHYPQLYPKSLEDCVCKFVIERQYGKETLAKYNFILAKIKDNIINNNAEADTVSTALFDQKLSDVKNESELEMFIATNSDVFASAYHKFYAYVKVSIASNSQKYKDSVYALALGQGWTSSLKQCVSAIRQGKWYPTRNKIISLGIHLSMDHEQIDTLLKLAYMEPLCAKNAFESIIIYILEDASLNDKLEKDSEEYDPDWLAKKTKKVLKQFDLPEIDSFIAELSEMDESEINDDE